jgi:cyclopropane-fatty-acyl-phospholipid synthase
LRFTLADGSALSPPGGEAVATVVFRSPLAALQVLRDPEGRFGEAYVRGDVSVQGDLVRALEEAYRLRQEGPRAAAGEEGRPRRDAARNVRRHYDLGNDFYRLWLDERMLYTCAYFPASEATLEEAQVAKMERVCRKLDLRPGERVVEAGCGWGAFALHMARHHGVTVTAYNLSREQIRFARERAGAEGLRDKVEFVEDDYRQIDGRFDAFVSLGMLEHVGVKSYEALGALLDRCLDPVHGRGLLHFIGQDQPTPLNPWIRRFIFPGAYPPTVGQALRGVLEGKAWTVLDVENLRAHYALTLRHWRTRFEAHADEVTARRGAAFTRRWRLYLAGSEAAFRTGALELFQVVFGRRGHDDLPWARVAP